MSEDRNNLGKRTDEDTEDVEAHSLGKPGLSKGGLLKANDEGDDDAVEAHMLQKQMTKNLGK